MCLDVGWAAREVSREECKAVVGLLHDSITAIVTPRYFPVFTRVRLIP